MKDKILRTYTDRKMANGKIKKVETTKNAYPVVEKTKTHLIVEKPYTNLELEDMIVKLQSKHKTAIASMQKKLDYMAKVSNENSQAIHKRLKAIEDIKINNQRRLK
jgi:hypothetical protein